MEGGRESCSPSGLILFLFIFFLSLRLPMHKKKCPKDALKVQHLKIMKSRTLPSSCYCAHTLGSLHVVESNYSLHIP